MQSHAAYYLQISSQSTEEIKSKFCVNCSYIVGLKRIINSIFKKVLGIEKSHLGLPASFLKVEIIDGVEKEWFSAKRCKPSMNNFSVEIARVILASPLTDNMDLLLRMPPKGSGIGNAESSFSKPRLPGGEAP